jgi:hypothetical protein
MFNVLASSSTIVNPAVTEGVHNILADVLQFGLLALTTAATWAVKLGINHLNSGWKQAVAYRLVAFAENRIPTDPEKLAYVSKSLSAHFPRLSADEIQHLIEEAVYNLKQGTQGPQG